MELAFPPSFLPHRQNWRQMDRDMWRIEKWLDLAKGTLFSVNRSVPTNMEQLEDAIQDHREFLMELDSHKNLMMSINVIAQHLCEHSRNQPKVAKLKERLKNINDTWDATCEKANDWQHKLQTALLEVRLTGLYFIAFCTSISLYLVCHLLLLSSLTHTCLPSSRTLSSTAQSRN